MKCKEFLSTYTDGLLRSRLTRKKIIRDDEVCNTKLDRCLSTLDLTALGIGSTLGLGVYVLAGQVARDTSGPSVVLSFLIAAIASVFAGLCYAEFGARVPRAGSAYVYSYVTVGEGLAFVVGWNLVLEYVIGTASVAKAYSGYFDFLVDHKINTTMEEVMPIRISWFADYPDFLAAGITILLTVVLAIGVKESSRFNNIFTFLNLFVVLYFIICGSFKIDFANWALPAGHGAGGFFPFGFPGMISGAATCFYGFVGFDCIATTGEEVKNPQKAIPISIVLSLLVIFLAYFGIAFVLTLMLPYYEQDETAALAYAFDYVGYPVAKWVVSIGALTGLSTSLLGAMFPLPRVLYAMGNDGVIFRFFAIVHPRFKTPLYSVALGGFCTAIMALLFSLKELIEMMSIGTLMAYTLVAASVLILRYKCDYFGEHNCAYEPLFQEAQFLTYKSEYDFSDDEVTNEENAHNADRDRIIRKRPYTSLKDLTRQAFNLEKLHDPSPVSFLVAKLSVAFIGLFSATTAACGTFARDAMFVDGAWWAILITSISVVFLLTTFIILCLQPQRTEQLNFKVPWVPVLPVVSVLFNVTLMLQLKYATWIRFAVWLFLGSLIYVFYGLRESSEEYRRKGLPLPENAEIEAQPTTEGEGCMMWMRRRGTSVREFTGTLSFKGQSRPNSTSSP